MGVTKREKWRCRTCRSKESRGVSSASSQGEPLTVQLQLEALNAKLDALMAVKENVETLMVLPARVDQLMSLQPAVNLLQSAVTEMQAAVDFLSNRYDAVLSTISRNEKTIKELQGETASLREVVSEQAVAIRQLQTDANDSEQYSRQSNLEISAMALIPNENLRERVSELAESLCIADYQACDVLAVHRLPAKKDKTPVVIVRFSSAHVRDKWMSARGKLRSLVDANRVPRMFLNENLTRANRELFWQARAKGKEKNYKFVWVKSGRIFARRSEGAPPVKILHASDLDKIV